MFKGSYSVAGPLSKYVHVDVDIAGCAPKPEAIIDGLALALGILQAKKAGTHPADAGIDHRHLAELADELEAEAKEEKE